MQVELDAQAPVLQVSAEPKEMLSVQVTPDGKHTTFRINFSSLSLMQECSRKTYYSLVRDLRSNLESPATLFGTAVHKALEVYYSGERSQRALPSNYKAIMEMIGVGQWEDEWGEALVFRAARAFVLKAAPLKALPDDNKRSIVTGVWILRHYFERYLDDEYTIVSDACGPMTERKFSMEIYKDESLTIEMFGTIDFVMRSEVTGLVMGGDHKTSSSLYDFYDMIVPNFQYTGYVWAIRNVLGFDSDSFLVNALEVKPKPKTSRGSAPNFARQVTTRTQEDFDELRDAMVLNTRIFSANMQAKTWPMTAPGPCNKYGGCQYREICASPKQLHETIISSRYTERT